MRAVRITALLMLGTALGGPASAGTTTWTGLGGGSLWSDAGNWNATVPVTGDDVVLAQTGTHAPTTFDISFNAKTLTFGNTTDVTTLANGYIINPGGGVFGLQSGGSITDNSNTSVIDQLNIAVALAGPATISGSHALLFGGVISGTGGLTIDNTGGIIFAADNTYTGGTTISAGGKLQIGNGGTAGSISGGVTNNGLLAFNRSDAFDFSGVITGSGAVTQLGSGVLTLSGSNSYTGGTVISNGTLAVGFDNNLGAASGSIEIDNGSTLQLNRGFETSRAVILGAGTETIDTTSGLFGPSVFTGVISGAGALNEIGAGSLYLTANNTYTGGTTIGAGSTLSLGLYGGGSSSGSVIGAIVDNGLLQFNRTDTVTFDNTISGSGQLQKFQTDTVILTGNSSFSGGTQIFAGTLQLGNGGTSGMITGDIALFDPAATIAFDHSDNITYAGDITGIGILSQMGSGTLVLTGANSLGGITIASGGTLQIGDGTNGSLSMFGAAGIVNDGVLAVDLASELTLNSDITGTGSFQQIGSGTTILAGTNTYSGGTTISSGTLQLGNGGTLGSIVGDVANSGTLVFNRGDTYTFGGIISGSGAVTQLGTGTTILTGANTYGGGTTISGGTLQIGNGGTAGSITGNVVDNGTLAFNRSDTISFSGAITGSGSVSQLGSGTLTLGGANTYSGGTKISAGILEVAGSGNLGSGAVTFSNGATLRFLGASSFGLVGSLGSGGGTFDTNGNAVTWSGVISGPGGLTKVGAGTLTLTGSDNYQGGTTISAGTLQVGNGGTSGAIEGDVVDNAILAFNRSDNFTFSGIVSGSGALTQNGTGILTLAGVNTYSGGTNINAGTVQISSDANLGNGGTVAMAAGTSLSITATGTFAHDVTVTGDPTFVIAPGATATWNGLISDGGSAGTVEVSGNGTLKLTNAANSYSGGTIVRGNATLSVAADGALGTGSLALGDAATAGTLAATASFTSARAVSVDAGGGTIDTAGTLALTQGITGAGHLTVTGAGQLTLTGASTYSGNTTISGATLQLGDGASAGSIVGNVDNQGALVFNEAGDVTFAGVVSGTGSLSQIDATAHTVTLTGANTYTGGTTITAGTLQLGNGGTTGAIAGDVVDNGALAFDRSDSVVFAGLISGTGAVNQIGSGTTILTGANTYSGGTTISAGTLQVGNGGSSGAITGAVTDNGTLSFNRSDTLVLAGAITGSGAVRQIGLGTTILSGNNTYSGGTTISAGTLQVGDGGVSGAIAGAVTDNGTLAFNRTDTLVVASVISGTGTLKQLGAGTVALTGNNTYSGGTTISAGTLAIGNGGASGAIVGNVVDNAALVFNRSDSFTLAGVISGSGSVAQNGAGTTILTGANIYTGTTTVSAGTLQLGNGGTGGSLISDVVDNAALVFDRSDALTYGGVISGTGSLGQIGAGTTILTGLNTYTGGTTISSGILQLGNGGSSGLIAGDVIDNATLSFNHSNTVVFNGVISGSGGLRQIGTGSVILGGASTYTGATLVQGGSLIVNGSLTSAVTVSSGTIGGTGTIGTLSVGANSVLAPGDGGIGTLTVTGNAALASNSIYALDLTSSTHDLLSVSGTANIAGILNVSPTGSGYGSTPITILTASGGLSGTFSNVSLLASVGSNLQAFVAYDAHNAYLLFMPTITSLIPASTPNSNSARLAAAIDFAITHDNAGLIFQPLASLSPADLDTTLAQMTGETATGVQSAAVSSTTDFMQAMLDPTIGSRAGLADGGGDRIAAQRPREYRLAYNGPNDSMPYEGQAAGSTWSLWTNVYGQHDQRGGDVAKGYHGINGTTFGGQIGLDYTPRQANGAIGIAFGAADQKWNLAQDLGKGHSTSFHVGVYYSRRFDENYFTSAFSYGHYDVSTERTLIFGGTNVYDASFSAWSAAARAEVGHGFKYDGGRITPFLSFQAADLGIPNYAETTVAGSPSFALAFTGHHHFDYMSEVGVAWGTLIGSTASTLTDLHAHLGWLHDYAGGLRDTATFSAFPGASFTVDGAPPPNDAANVTLGLQHDFDNMSLTVNGQSTLGAGATSYGGSVALSVDW